MANWSYINTGSPEDVLQIQDITSTPGSLTPASEWQADIRAVALAEIEDGAYLELAVKVGLIKLPAKRHDLFESLRTGTGKDGWSLRLDSGIPIKRGNLLMTLTVQLPRELPRAKFAITIRAYTAEGDNLASLDFKADFTTTA